MPVHAEYTAKAREMLLTQAPHTRAFPGCQYLHLYEGEGPTFYSLSLWASAAHLEKYRSSTRFRTFWAQLKPLFRAPARAISLTALGEFH